MNNSETIFWVVLNQTIEIAIETAFEAAFGSLFNTASEVKPHDNQHDEFPAHFKYFEPFYGLRNACKDYNPSSRNDEANSVVNIGEPISDIGGSSYVRDHSDPFEGLDPFRTPETADPYTSYSIIYEEQMEDSFEFVKKELDMMTEIQELHKLVELADIDLNEDIEV